MSTVAHRPKPKEIFEWWKWALSISDTPGSPHPGKGGNIDTKQPVGFFCYACTFGSGTDPKRSYHVKDPKKKLMIPVLTTEATLLENPGFNDQQLLNKASYDLQNPQDLFLNVDGEYILTLQNALKYYVESAADSVTLAPNNILGLPAKQTRMRCVGYFALLDPLSRGVHEITFGGSAGPPNDKINTLVNYEITV
jgi:hypothetical protein